METYVEQPTVDRTESEPVLLERLADLGMVIRQPLELDGREVGGQGKPGTASRKTILSVWLVGSIPRLILTCRPKLPFPFFVSSRR